MNNRFHYNLRMAIQITAQILDYKKTVFTNLSISHQLYKEETPLKYLIERLQK